MEQQSISKQIIRDLDPFVIPATLNITGTLSTMSQLSTPTQYAQPNLYLYRVMVSVETAPVDNSIAIDLYIDNIKLDIADYDYTGSLIIPSNGYKSLLTFNNSKLSCPTINNTINVAITSVGTTVKGADMLVKLLFYV